MGSPFTHLEAQIWDTAGPERFAAYGVAFHRGTDVGLLVFDVTSERSFNALHAYKQQCAAHCTPVFVVVGTKIDLVEKRVVC